MQSIKFVGLLTLISVFFGMNLLAQSEKTERIDYKTQIISNGTIILLSETTPPEFDGFLDIEKEYKEIQPVSFPCEKNTPEEPCPPNRFAKVYIKQSGGVLFFGFHVPKTYQIERFIQIAVSNDPEHVASFIYNPLNVHRVSPLFKEFILNNDSTQAPLHNVLAKSSTAHKDYWTAEIAINLRELKINPGMMGQQLYILFSVSDSSKKAYFSRYFQGWHTSSSYFLLRSKDNWGKENPDTLVQQSEVSKVFQHYLALNNIYLKADNAFKKHNTEAAINWLELLIELDKSYYNVAQKIAELYFNINELEKALAAVDNALRINPFYLDSLVYKGGIYLQMGKKEEALRHFRLLYAEYPSKTELALQIGKIYIDMTIQARLEIDKAESDEQKQEKTQNYRKLLTSTQAWFDGLAISNLDDIRVLISIASLVRHSEIDINLQKFIKLAENLVEENVQLGASLLSFYCFNRDEKTALEMTHKLAKRLAVQRQESFDNALKFQGEQEEIIRNDKNLTSRQRTDAIRTLNERAIRMRNSSYMHYVEMISELADIFKKHNIFSGFIILMQQLHNVINERHFPRQTLEGAAAEEKIIAEYIVSLLASEDFDAAIKVYEKLKDIVTSPHSAVINYLEAYKDVIHYKKYWELETQKRKDEAKANLPIVKIHTQKGVITCVLFEDDAPNTVKNFIKNIQAGIYKNNLFHRVEPAFIVQGGITEKPLGNIASEIKTRNFFRGTLGMANIPNVENSETTQFFITILPIPWLNETHTVFGRVIEGLDVLDAITESDAILKIEIIRKREKTDYTPVYSESKQKTK